MFKLCSVFASVSMLAACTTSTSQPPLTYEPPNAAIEKLGYETLALPSTAYGPGSLVTTVKGSGFASPLKLTYLCRPDFTHTPAPIIDAAASAEASRAFTGVFKLDATVLGQMGVGAGANYIDSVNLKFNNVKIEQLAYDDLDTVMANLGPKCKKRVDEFASESLAYQTKQAIRADVTYTATFKRGVSADAKNIAIASLQSTFGGSVQNDSNSSVTGSGLYYGLILNKL
ncbi:conserved exported hypothetical protein [Mesorhizobium plurifarium]|uniref:Lipoprotein n=1 Tax=Mesorhizobium plurifarium TaxID=69974 RepID=A0A090G7W9_MESPL|nr:conserved exported hypothetical protein [Mesorhizobium plurifarium]